MPLLPMKTNAETGGMIAIQSKAIFEKSSFKIAAEAVGFVSEFSD